MAPAHLGDPALGRFNPLPRILFLDDFDTGVNGWCELIGNHDGDLDRVRPVVADTRPPQLSTLAGSSTSAAAAVWS